MEGVGNLSGPEKRELLARLLKAKAATQGHARIDEFPLSAGQQGLWYAYRRDPHNTAYNVALPSRFRSPIDLNAMRRSIETLVSRHGALRTLFVESKTSHQPVQRIQPSLPPEFRVVETPNAEVSQIVKWVSEEIGRPFDLSHGPMLRLAAFRIATDDVVLVATTHHIVVDFWSLVLIMEEIQKLYSAYVSGAEPKLAPATSNYDRFVRAQSELIASERGQTIGKYWKNQLAGVPPLLELPTDFQRPDKFTHRASTLPLRFPPQTGANINSLARQFGVTANVVVMALLQVFIGRFSAQDSFSIGTPFSGRSQRDFEKTVGFFVNLLPITTDLSSNPTLEQLIATVSEKMVDALANESLPFSEIVRECDIARDPRHHPLFQVSCTFEKSQLASERGRAGFVLGDDQVATEFAGMRQEGFPIALETCHYDLEFVFEFDGDALRGVIYYCRDLFEPATIQSMAREFVGLSSRLMDSPSIPVKQVKWIGSQTSRPVQADDQRKTLVTLLADSPHPILTLAKRFATCLRRRGVQPRALVPVCLDRGHDAWVGILGVIFCGATPIPIDADQPAVAAEVLEGDAQIDFVVSRPGDPWAESFDVPLVSVEEISDDDAPSAHDVAPDDLAYVIYTSGSTGKPKGVMVSHRAIANTIDWQQSATPFSSDDRAMTLLSHQFDATWALVITTLHQNAIPIWTDGRTSLDLDKLIDRITGERVTILETVTSVLRALAEHPRFAQCTSLRQIWTGAETMPTGLPELIRSKLDCELWNCYGPTEAAIQVTVHRVDDVAPRRRIPIGREISGVSVHLLDGDLAPLPIGVPGQIAISGQGLADGYLNRPELTRQAFIHSKHICDAHGNPLRIYLTGDLGRRRCDGTLEFLGRVDHQVKVRGYRIELEEIEHVIEQVAEVRRAAVKVVRSGTPGERLAAFIVGLDQDNLDGLNRHLSTQLPPYKRPASVTLLGELPLNSNGKIDRDRLPDPTDNAIGAQFETRPRSALERFLVSRFASALELDELGIDVNFFEAGGTSLQAAILTSQLSDELGFSIPTSLLFDLGDVRAVSSRLVELHEPQMRLRFGDESIDTAARGRKEISQNSLLVELKPTGQKQPIFMVHPPGGIVVCYRELASRLTASQPLVAIRSRGLHGDERLPSTMHEMAADYVRSIVRYRPSGPSVIGGWSLGGVIAFEVARQLVAIGHEVSGLILLDSTLPEQSDCDAPSAGIEYGLELTLAQLSELSIEQQLPFLYSHAQRLGVLKDDAPQEVVQKAIEDLHRLFAHHVTLCQSYELQPLRVPVLLIRPSDVPGQADARTDRGWERWTGKVTVGVATGHHHSMVQSPGAIEIAAQIERFVV